MKKKSVLIIGLFFLISLICTGAFGMEMSELIENGSFEDVDSRGNASGWQMKSYRSQEGLTQMFITNERARSGENSAFIENINMNDTRFVYNAKVKPSSLYRLSAYVWIEHMEMEGNGANLGLEDIYSSSEGLFTTVGQWEKITWYGETGPGQKKVSVGVRLGGYGSESVGKVYFDDVSLVEVEELPDNVIASIWYSTTNQNVVKKEEPSKVKNTNMFIIASLGFLALAAFLIKSIKRDYPSSTKIEFFIALLLGLFVRFILGMYVEGYQVDMSCFNAWSMRMADVGPSGFYVADYFCDYPPGFLMLLWPIGFLLKWAQGLDSEVIRLIIKTIPIVFDVLLAGVIYILARKNGFKLGAIIVMSLYLFSPAVLVNGSAWGQVDNVLAFMMLAVTIFTIRGKWKIALPLYFIAVLLKPQALLFGPVGLGYALITLYNDYSKKKLLDMFWGMVIGILCSVAVILPFAISQANPFTWIFSLYSETLGSYGYATLNTANLYYLANANWVSVQTQTPIVLTISTALVSLVIVLFIVKNNLKNKIDWTCIKTQMAILFTLLMGLNIYYAISQASYQLYGYTLMTFVYIFVLICLFHYRKTNNLSYYLALTLIGIYLFAVKVHERYLFVALPLLLYSYITSKDKRVLWIFVGFSITTFVNTAIVLDNSILFGAENGHLNRDTHFINMLLGILNLALCGYAGFVGYNGLKESVKFNNVANENTVNDEEVNRLINPKKQSMRLGRKDVWIMLVVSVMYSCVGFFQLGSVHAPQAGWVSSSSNEEVTFEIDSDSPYSLVYYAGVSYQPFSISTSNDGESWTEAYPCEMNEGLCYRWQYALNSSQVGGETSYSSNSPSGVRWLEGKYLRLNAEHAGLNLFEIVAHDKQGNVLPIKIIEHNGANTTTKIGSKPPTTLIDEQHTYTGEPSWFNGTYFDEIYHARTAYEHLHGQNPYETTHPPLGKLFMSASIALFGMTPFGWRFAGALFGVLMLPAIYLLAFQLTKKRSIAGVSMIAFALDLMHFTQTRIATIDSFPVFFIIMSYYFMARYIQLDSLVLNVGEQPKALTKSFWKGQGMLLCSGIMMGLSIACKWIGLYSAVGLAILFFYSIYRQINLNKVSFKLSDAMQLNEKQQNRVDLAQKFTWNRIFVTCALCVVYFILIPALIYYVCYIPYLLPSGNIGIQSVINSQVGMLNYHSTPGLGMDHPFQSPWWQWPFIQKPMWFAQDTFEPTGYASTIICMGNPVIFYVGAVSMLIVLGLFILNCTNTKWGKILRKQDKNLMFVILSIGVLSQYLPWVLVPRSMYIYHYFASVPFIIIATAWLINRLPNEKHLRTIITFIYLGLALIAFIAFFPYASGLMVSTEWLDAMKWFPKIYY